MVVKNRFRTKLLVFLAGCLLFPHVLSAQGRFVPGYVVNNTGDTVYCELLNTGREESSMDYIYKVPVNDSLIRVTPYNVLGFGTHDGKKFMRAKAIVETSGNRIYSIADTARGLQWEERFIFLQLLTEGESATLYYFFDDGKNFFYFQMDTTALIPLIYKKYSIEPTPNVSEGYIINNTFRDQLAYYLSCGNLPSQARTLDYSTRSLMAYFRAYFECTGESYHDYVRISGGRFHLRGVLISDYSTLRIEDGVTAYYSYPPGMNFGAGLEAVYAFAYNREKWALFLEGNYHHFTATDASYSLGTTVPESRVVYSSIEIPAGVSYSLILNKTNCFFLKAGIAPELILENAYLSFDVNNSANRYSLTPTTGLVFGAGYRYRFLSIEVRVRSKKNISRNIYLHESTLRIYSLRLAFSFF
ncbi:MAG: hypothetical protein J7K46_00020 [Bacteroidales bacterium]|nr:hypothetical protein [Bacteroidales bacterium]